MSCKSIYSNSVGSYRQNSFHEKLTTLSEEKIKFAGNESKDRLYDPKPNKKMVRVVTVIIYIFSVSLAAIMLSLYYGFFWKASPYSAMSSFKKSQLVDSGNYNKSCCSKCAENTDNDLKNIPEPTPIPIMQHKNILTTANSTIDYVETLRAELEVPEYEDTFVLLNNNESFVEKEKRYAEELRKNITWDSKRNSDEPLMQRLKNFFNSSSVITNNLT